MDYISIDFGSDFAEVLSFQCLSLARAMVAHERVRPLKQFGVRAEKQDLKEHGKLKHGQSQYIVFTLEVPVHTQNCDS